MTPPHAVDKRREKCMNIYIAKDYLISMLSSLTFGRGPVVTISIRLFKMKKGKTGEPEF